MHDLDNSVNLSDLDNENERPSRSISEFMVEQEEDDVMTFPSGRRTSTVKKKTTIGGISRQTTTRYTRGTTMRTTEVITLDSFERIKKLGDGAYGIVYLVKKKDTKQIYALKELEKDHILRYGKYKAVMREKDILESVCDNKYIISLECTFQDENSLYFLLEFASKGSLSDLIKNVK